MPWSKFDDNFWGHPKTIAAGTTAVGLLVKAITYSNHYLTDGLIPLNIMPMLAPDIDYKAAAEKLVEVGYFTETEKGYQIHDFLEYNPSAEQVRAQREKDKARKSGWREEHRGADGTFQREAQEVQDVQEADDDVCPSGIQTESAESPSTPCPCPLPLPNNISVISNEITDAGLPARPLKQTRRRARSPTAVHYHEKTGVWPTTVQENAIADMVTDSTFWDDVLNTWMLRGNKPNNVDGQLRWYRTGIPEGNSFRKSAVRTGELKREEMEVIDPGTGEIYKRESVV